MNEMTLDNILKEWEEDSKIDEIHLDVSSRKTPEIHSKYLGKRARVKIKLKKCKLDQQILLKQKWLYYNGKMTQDEIDDKGWEYDPFNGLKVLKGEMNRYYDADIDIQNSEKKIEYYQVLLETLDEIIKNINWRGNTIKNIVEWKKFQNGGF